MMYFLQFKNEYGISKGMSGITLGENEIEISEELCNEISCPCRFTLDENGQINFWEECTLPLDLFLQIEPKPEVKTITEILQEENKILKIQIQAMNSNQMFLEDCIIELAQEIYK